MAKKLTTYQKPITDIIHQFEPILAPIQGASGDNDPVC